jgi:hypothetical protein
MVAARFGQSYQLLEITLQFLPVFLHSLPVDAWGTFAPCSPVGFFHPVHVQIMVQRCEAHLRSRCGQFCYL